LSFREELTQ